MKVGPGAFPLNGLSGITGDWRREGPRDDPLSWSGLGRWAARKRLAPVGRWVGPKAGPGWVGVHAGVPGGLPVLVDIHLPGGEGRGWGRLGEGVRVSLDPTEGIENTG